MSAIEAVLSFVDSQFKEREIQPPVFRNDTLAEGYEFKEADKDDIIKDIKSDCQSKGQQVIIKDQKRSERKDLRDPPYIRVILTCHNAGSCNSKHEKLAKEDGGRPNTSTKKVACGAKIVLGRTVNKDGTTTPWKVSALHWLHNHPVGEDATTLRASLSPDEERQVAQLRELGFEYSKIRQLLQSKRSDRVLLQRISNAAEKYHHQIAGGRSDISILTDQLSANNYRYKVFKSLFLLCSCTSRLCCILAFYFLHLLNS
jgi:hypothetical protein